MNDLSIVRRMMAGDRNAYEPLFKNYVDGVEEKTRSILRDEDMCRQVVKLVFQDVFAKAGELKDAGQFDEWLDRLIVYHCGAMARKIRQGRKKDELWKELSLSFDPKEAQGAPKEASQRPRFMPGEEQSPPAEGVWEPIIFPIESYEEEAERARKVSQTMRACGIEADFSEDGDKASSQDLDRDLDRDLDQDLDADLSPQAPERDQPPAQSQEGPLQAEDEFFREFSVEHQPVQPESGGEEAVPSGLAADFAAEFLLVDYEVQALEDTPQEAQAWPELQPSPDWDGEAQEREEIESSLDKEFEPGGDLGQFTGDYSELATSGGVLGAADEFLRDFMAQEPREDQEAQEDAQEREAEKPSAPETLRRQPDLEQEAVPVLEFDLNQSGPFASDSPMATQGEALEEADYFLRDFMDQGADFEEKDGHDPFEAQAGEDGNDDRSLVANMDMDMEEATPVILGRFADSDLPKDWRNIIDHAREMDVDEDEEKILAFVVKVPAKPVAKQRQETEPEEPVIRPWYPREEHQAQPQVQPEYGERPAGPQSQPPEEAQSAESGLTVMKSASQAGDYEEGEGEQGPKAKKKVRPLTVVLIVVATLAVLAYGAQAFGLLDWETTVNWIMTQLAGG